MTSTTVETKLSASWLNAWLAAIGCAVLVPGLRLSWTSSAEHSAVLDGAFDHPDALVAAVAEAVEAIDYRELLASRTTSRNPMVSEYRLLCAEGRRTGDPTISLLTDLHEEALSSQEGAKVSPGAFYPPAPGPASTFGKRFATLETRVPGSKVDLVRDALVGNHDRIEWNGLGFDYTKGSIPTDPKRSNLVVPGVELLALVGSLLFPHRGDGRVARTRGWTAGTSRVGALRWWAWPEPLSAPAIDGVLDVLYAGSDPVGTLAAFELVPYQPLGLSDPTRGYGARRLA